MRQPDVMSGLITRDPEMLRICRTIEKVAPSSVTVMLLGESGTGKEVLARGLHNASPRRDARFVAQCGPKSLTQHNARVLHRVVKVHLDIAHSFDFQIKQPVLGKKRQHVVEEGHPGINARCSRTIDDEFDVDGRFRGSAVKGGLAG